jgi:hypothetical protein
VQRKPKSLSRQGRYRISHGRLPYRRMPSKWCQRLWDPVVKTFMTAWFASVDLCGNQLRVSDIHQPSSTAQTSIMNAGGFCRDYRTDAFQCRDILRSQWRNEAFPRPPHKGLQRGVYGLQRHRPLRRKAIHDLARPSFRATPSPCAAGNSCRSTSTPPDDVRCGPCPELCWGAMTPSLAGPRHWTVGAAGPSTAGCQPPWR